MASKPQEQYKEGSAKDDLFSPGYCLIPLLEFLPREAILWEPAVGAGYMANSLEYFGYKTIRSGFASSLAKNQENFLAGYQPTQSWDIQVTNPPFNPKIAWMKQLLKLGKPWALLVQDDTPALGSYQRLVRDLSPKIGLLWFSPRVAFRTPSKNFIPGEGWTWMGYDKKKKKEVPTRSSAQFGTLWITWGLGFTGNVERPQSHWTQNYRKRWEVWHEEGAGSPPA